MLVYHITNVAYLPSIIRRGLAPGMARRAKRIWACTTVGAVLWAIRHLQDEHGWSPHQMAVTTWSTPREKWCGSGRRGVVWSPSAIGNEHLRGVSRLVSTGISRRGKLLA